MTWDSFVPDLIVAVASAIITVLVAAVTYLITIRRRERNALQSLIEEIHRRRALTVVGSVGRVRRAKRLDDFHRLSASVVSLRDEITRTRAVVREAPRFQDPLARMRLACNQYLELSERDPDSYYILAARLRREMVAGIRKLTEARRGLNFKPPGDGAL